MSEHFDNIIALVAFTFMGIGVIGLLYIGINLLPSLQPIQAILCPVDEVSEHAENIFTHLQNYDYDKARAESQNLINLVDKLEQDKIDEDNSGFSMYN